MTHLYIIIAFLESPASISNRRKIDFKKQSTWISISLVTLNKLVGCFWSYFVNTSSYIFWFYFKFLTWKRKMTELISLGVIETSSWKLICFILFKSILEIYFWNLGLSFYSRPMLSRISRMVTRFHNTDVDKEGKILQLASTGGRQEVPAGDQREGPMPAAPSWESQTEMMPTQSEKGTPIRGDMKGGADVSHRAVERRALNLPGTKGQGNFWEAGMEKIGKDRKEGRRKGEILR